MRKNRILIVAAVVGLLLVVPAVAVAAGGFDQFGYNRQARIFVGSASGWCVERGDTADCLGDYSNDHLVMKWNAEWDRGNAENWEHPPYAAWLNNEWNGNGPGGSGESEIFKTVWDQGCVDSKGVTSSSGGKCIWGQFAVLMDHYPNGEWVAKANPAGYGAYR